MKNTPEIISQIDRALIKGKTTVTDEGFLLCDAVVTRCGVFDYYEDGRIDRRYRPESEVFNQDSLKSMALKPVTAFHPAEQMVVADNANKLKVGSIGENQRRHENDVMSNFVVTDKKAIDLIDSGVKQLSLGYTCEIVREPGTTPDGLQYDSYQKNIKYNHLAIVPVGRAGNASIVTDSADSIQIDSKTNFKNTEQKMEYVKIVHDGVTYDIEPAFVDTFKSLQADSAELVKAKEQLDAKDKEINALKISVDDLEKRQLDESEVLKKAEELASVIAVAKSQLDSIDGKGADELKKELVVKAYPEIELDSVDLDTMYLMSVKKFETDSSQKPASKNRSLPTLDKQNDEDVNPRDKYIAGFKKKRGEK